MVKQTVSSFSEEVSRIMPYLVRGMFRKQKDALGEGKLTIPQYLSLALLDSGGQLKMKDIAKELGISLPAATGLITRLFKMSLIERVYGQKDRRIIYIRLTPKGKSIVGQVRLKRQKAVKGVFGKLTEGERLTYLRILRKLIGILYPKKK